MGELRARALTIAWLLYGSIDERTGGTIYDRIVIEGLRARGRSVEVLDPRMPTNALMRKLVRARAIVGDELCFRELAFVFPRVRGARLLLVHHLTCWEEERRAAERRRARVREARALRAADVIVTTSDATRARLEREGFRGPMHVVRPGSDRLGRVAADAPAKRTRFLFVGAVTARKRVRELVRAWPPGTELRVIGSVHRDRRYAELLRAEAPGAVFLGEVDDDTLARELARADALVMPSSLEGYGIAATEAIHAGLPVIATRTPGLEEALAPCPSAVLFARSDSSDLARVLHDFSTNEALRVRLRAAAEAARLPTWTEAVERFASVVT